MIISAVRRTKRSGISPEPTKNGNFGYATHERTHARFHRVHNKPNVVRWLEWRKACTVNRITNLWNDQRHAYNTIKRSKMLKRTKRIRRQFETEKMPAKCTIACLCSSGIYWIGCAFSYSLYTGIPHCCSFFMLISWSNLFVHVWCFTPKT